MSYVILDGETVVLDGDNKVKLSATNPPDDECCCACYGDAFSEALSSIPDKWVHYSATRPASVSGWARFLRGTTGDRTRLGLMTCLGPSLFAGEFEARVRTFFRRGSADPSGCYLAVGWQPTFPVFGEGVSYPGGDIQWVLEGRYSTLGGTTFLSARAVYGASTTDFTVGGAGSWDTTGDEFELRVVGEDHVVDHIDAYVNNSLFTTATAVAGLDLSDGMYVSFGAWVIDFAGQYYEADYLEVEFM